MGMPFTAEQFFEVFAAYNAAIWPVQIIAYALGLIAVAMLWSNWSIGKQLVLPILAIMWLWNGLAYHLMFFSPINPAAKGFAAIFIVQATILAATSIDRGSLQLEVRRDPRSFLGLAVIFYALFVYELLGYLSGHGLMKGPLFGVTPCPTTIFTVGVLLLARGKPVIWLAIIPVIWSMLGVSAAVLFDVREDFALAVAATMLVVVLVADFFTDGASQELRKR
jgi:hypothetical protein